MTGKEKAMRKPFKSINMPATAKQKKVKMMKSRISEYNTDIHTLIDDLNNLPPIEKKIQKKTGMLNVSGCFDPDAEGFDLLAESPVDQAIQLLIFDCGLDSNTVTILQYWKLLRIGDVIITMVDKSILDLPGMGPKRYQKIADCIEKLGIPVNWIEKSRFS